MGKIKLLADENVRREVVSILDNLGVDIEHISEIRRRVRVKGSRIIISRGRRKRKKAT